MENINTKQEIKLLKAFSKLWKESGNEPPILPEEDIFYISNCNIFGIVLKSNDARRIFKRFIDKDRLISMKLPPLDYTPNKLHDLNASKYNTETLKLILDCFNSVEDKALFKINKDYPLMIEGEHFNFILAPIVE